MHIPFVHCSTRIAGRYTIHRCHAWRVVHKRLVPVLELGLHCGFVFRVRLWFTPVVTHVSPYPFSMLLSNPCPIAVLVNNGIAHPRLERVEFGRFIVVIPRGNPGEPRQDH